MISKEDVDEIDMIVDDGDMDDMMVNYLETYEGARQVCPKEKYFLYSIIKTMFEECSDFCAFLNPQLL